MPLSDGTFALVDEADAPAVLQHTWTAMTGGYAHRGIGPRRSRTYVTLHVQIAQPQPGSFVDHRDGNRWDCRRSNLRVAGTGPNAENKAQRCDSLQPYKGVQRKRGKRWLARITAGGERHHLGTFDTAEAAARAYDEAARRLHGDFACVNFPSKDERCALAKEAA